MRAFGKRHPQPWLRPHRPPRGAADPHAPIAALDLGTNNCRLLVARPEGEDFIVLDAFSRAVHLGEGVEYSGTLDSEAQMRALKALRICAAKMRRHRVVRARVVATEACRRAVNGPIFVRRVGRELGLRMEIISAEEEARLAVAGCAPLLDPDAEQLLVIDIGGGSTELIWVDMSRTPPSRRRRLIRALAPPPPGVAETADSRAAAAHITDWISVPVGVSTLHERFAHIADPAERFAVMAACFESHLADFRPYRVADRAALAGQLQIIGVSGTPTTFGALHLGLETYDRRRVDGLWLPSGAAERIAAELVEAARAQDGGTVRVSPMRAPLLLSGAAILISILRLWPVERMRVADRGLREGLLYGLIGQRRLRDS